MKKLLKWAFILLFSFIVIGMGAIMYLSQEMPKTTPTAEADQVARNIEAALNKPAWDSLKYLHWNFRTGTEYLWNKKDNTALIKWSDVEVLLDLDKVEGDVIKGDVVVENDKKVDYIQNAWSRWCNDSFWMFAPFKFFDPGVKRALVKDEETGKSGLMISYESGGVTPGDSYLWFYNEKYQPTDFKMWVKILPVGGTAATWDKWIQLQGGAWVSTFHKIGPIESPVTGVKEGSSYKDFGYTEDPFVFL